MHQKRGVGGEKKNRHLSWKIILRRRNKKKRMRMGMGRRRGRGDEKKKSLPLLP